MRTIRVDDNAYEILSSVKEKMKRNGIESPSFSDAIRYMYGGD